MNNLNGFLETNESDMTIEKGSRGKINQARMNYRRAKTEDNRKSEDGGTRIAIGNKPVSI